VLRASFLRARFSIARPDGGMSVASAVSDAKSSERREACATCTYAD